MIPGSICGVVIDENSGRMSGPRFPANSNPLDFTQCGIYPETIICGYRGWCMDRSGELLVCPQECYFGVHYRVAKQQSAYIMIFLTRYNELENDDRKGDLHTSTSLSLVLLTLCWWRHNWLHTTLDDPTIVTQTREKRYHKRKISTSLLVILMAGRVWSSREQRECISGASPKGSSIKLAWKPDESEDPAILQGHHLRNSFHPPTLKSSECYITVCFVSWRVDVVFPLMMSL